MALERAFQLMSEQLRLLKEAVDELQLNVSGDYHPESQSERRINGDAGREEAPLPVQQMADAVSELQGAIDEAQHAAAAAERAARYPRRLLETHLALVLIQRRLNGILRIFLEEVNAYETMQTLLVMGHRKGGKWPAWVALVKSVIEACRPPLYETFQAVSECWQELTDKLSAKTISLQMTNIGRQITSGKIPEQAGHEST